MPQLKNTTGRKAANAGGANNEVQMLLLLLRMPAKEVNDMEKRIYLDHAATTPLDKRVLKAMLPFFSGKFGNAGSLHSFGQEAREAVEKSRGQIAKAINAKPEECIMIGDREDMDILPAKKAGLYTVRVLRGKYRNSPKKTKADATITDFRKLPSTVLKLSR